jgi:hypothetical protein
MYVLAVTVLAECVFPYLSSVEVRVVGYAKEVVVLDCGRVEAIASARRKSRANLPWDYWHWEVSLR